MITRSRRCWSLTIIARAPLPPSLSIIILSPSFWQDCIDNGDVTTPAASRTLPPLPTKRRLSWTAAAAAAAAAAAVVAAHYEDEYGRPPGRAAPVRPRGPRVLCSRADAGPTANLRHGSVEMRTRADVQARVRCLRWALAMAPRFRQPLIYVQTREAVQVAPREAMQVPP